MHGANLTYPQYPVDTANMSHLCSPPPPFHREQGMASESDVILLSCLAKAPAAGEAILAVRAALQKVIVRAPSATIHTAGLGGGRAPQTAAAAAGGGATPSICAICPSAHAAIVDAKLLRAFPVTRARTILAGLSPLPTDGAPELPTVVVGVAAGGGPPGLCFLGQRAASEGYSSFSVRREAGSEGGSAGGQALRIDDLMYEYGGRVQASARALYDLWGTSNGDVLGGCLQEGVNKSSPFARLATEWDCASHATRTLGSPPPPACSSLLLVGGACPPSMAALALRGDIETLSVAAGVRLAGPTEGLMKAKGPFGGGAGGSSGDAAGISTTAEMKQEMLRWEDDLQALLSGSENMAELAARPRVGQSGDGENEGGDGSERGEGAQTKAEDDTAIQERKDGGGVPGDEELGAGPEEQAANYRGDLDFSERLWELAARASGADKVRSMISSAFDAVGEGHIFPVVSRYNQTAVGCHIRDGVAMAREARYHDARSVGVGVPVDEVKAKAWRERGSAMLADLEILAETFVELGVHKVTRDLLHWLEAHAGVLAAEIDRALPASNDKGFNERDSAGEEGRKAAIPPANPPSSSDRRLDRLVTLADTLDLVALAQSYGAPWRQVRALAHGGLATLGRRVDAVSADGATPSSPPSPVFPLGLPKPIPPRARCKLAHPVFWELLLEPATRQGGAGEGAATGALGALETISYTLATAGLFQLKGVGEPPVLSRGAALAAQSALKGCPAHMIPEVLSSVAGVESLVELKRRQQERRIKGGAVTDDVTAVFVCEHRFTPW